MNDCFKENEADIIYLFNNSLPELTHSDFSDSIFSQYFNILKEDGLFIFDFENLDEYNNDLASHDFKGIRREKIFKKNNEEYYWVNYYYFDVTKKLSDSLILSRPHSQNLCNIDFLTSKLKDHGFSSINIEKIEGYPFNIMIAKK